MRTAYTFIIVIALKCHMNGIYSVNRKASMEKEKGARGRGGVEDQVKGIRELQFVLQVWPQIKLNHFSVCDTYKDQLGGETEREREIERENRYKESASIATTSTIMVDGMEWIGIGMMQRYWLNAISLLH